MAMHGELLQTRKNKWQHKGEAFQALLSLQVFLYFANLPLFLQSSLVCIIYFFKSPLFMNLYVDPFCSIEIFLYLYKVL